MQVFISMLLLLLIACGVNLADPSVDQEFEPINNQPPPQAWQPLDGDIYFSQIYPENSLIQRLDGRTGIIESVYGQSQTNYMPSVDNADTLLFTSRINGSTTNIYKYDMRNDVLRLILDLDDNIIFPRETSSGARMVFVIEGAVDTLAYIENGSTTINHLYTASTSSELIKGPIWNSSGNTVYFQSQFGDFNNSTISRININTKNLEGLVQGAFPDLNDTNTKMLYARNNSIFEFDFATSTGTLVINAGSNTSANNPVYSPNGSKVVYTALSGNLFHLHVVNIDGSNNRKLLTQIRDAVYMNWID